MIKSAAGNVFAAGGLKCVGIVYSILALGALARELPVHELPLLLLASSLLIPLTLVQAGAGLAVLRTTSAAHARGDLSAAASDVSRIFITLACISIPVLVVYHILLAGTKWSFIRYAIVITSISTVFSLGDQVRLAVGKSWISNAVAALCYVAAIGLFFLSGDSVRRLEVAVLFAYSVPSIATIVSFVLLLSDVNLRSLFTKRLVPDFGWFLRVTGPGALISLGSAVLLNVFSWMDRERLTELSDAVIIFRIMVIAVSSIALLCMPLLPALSRAYANGNPREAKSLLAAYFGVFGLLSILLSSLVAIWGDQIALLWLGSKLTTTATLVVWGLVLMLWLFGMLANQYLSLFSDPVRVVMILGLTNVVLYVVMYGLQPTASDSVALGFVVGLGSYCIPALILCFGVTRVLLTAQKQLLIKPAAESRVLKGELGHPRV